jgi:hypothetical protein
MSMFNYFKYEEIGNMIQNKRIPNYTMFLPFEQYTSYKWEFNNYYDTYYQHKFNVDKTIGSSYSHSLENGIMTLKDTSLITYITGERLPKESFTLKLNIKFDDAVGDQFSFTTFDDNGSEFNNNGFNVLISDNNLTFNVVSNMNEDPQYTRLAFGLFNNITSKASYYPLSFNDIILTYNHEDGVVKLYINGSFIEAQNNRNVSINTALTYGITYYARDDNSFITSKLRINKGPTVLGPLSHTVYINYIEIIDKLLTDKYILTNYDTPFLEIIDFDTNIVYDELAHYTITISNIVLNRNIQGIGNYTYFINNTSLPDEYTNIQSYPFTHIDEAQILTTPQELPSLTNIPIKLIGSFPDEDNVVLELEKIVNIADNNPNTDLYPNMICELTGSGSDLTINIFMNTFAFSYYVINTFQINIYYKSEDLPDSGVFTPDTRFIGASTNDDYNVNIPFGYDKGFSIVRTSVIGYSGSKIPVGSLTFPNAVNILENMFIGSINMVTEGSAYIALDKNPIFDYTKAPLTAPIFASAFNNSYVEEVTGQNWHVNAGTPVLKEKSVVLNEGDKIQFDNFTNIIDNINDEICYVFRAKFGGSTVSYFYFIPYTTNGHFRIRVFRDDLRLYGYADNNTQVFEVGLDSVSNHVDITQYNTYFLTYSKSSQLATLYINDNPNYSASAYGDSSIGFVPTPTSVQINCGNGVNGIDIDFMAIYKRSFQDDTFRLNWYNNYMKTVEEPAALFVNNFNGSYIEDVTGESWTDVNVGNSILTNDRLILYGDSHLNFMNVTNIVNNVSNELTLAFRLKCSNTSRFYFEFDRSVSNSCFIIKIDNNTMSFYGYTLNATFLISLDINDLDTLVNINDFNTFYMCWNSLKHKMNVYINDGSTPINTTDAYGVSQEQRNAGITFDGVQTGLSMKNFAGGDVVEIDFFNIFGVELTETQRVNYYNAYMNNIVLDGPVLTTAFNNSMLDSVTGSSFSIGLGEPSLNINDIILHSNNVIQCSDITEITKINREMTFIFRAKVGVDTDFVFSFIQTQTYDAFKVTHVGGSLIFKAFTLDNVELCSTIIANIDAVIDITKYNTYFITWNSLKHEITIFINNNAISYTTPGNTVTQAQRDNGISMISVTDILLHNVGSSSDPINIDFIEIYNREFSDTHRLDYYNDYMDTVIEDVQLSVGFNGTLKEATTNFNFNVFNGTPIIDNDSVSLGLDDDLDFSVISSLIDNCNTNMTVGIRCAFQTNTVFVLEFARTEFNSCFMIRFENNIFAFYAYTILNNSLVYFIEPIISSHVDITQMNTYFIQWDSLSNTASLYINGLSFPVATSSGEIFNLTQEERDAGIGYLPYPASIKLTNTGGGVIDINALEIYSKTFLQKDRDNWNAKYLPPVESSLVFKSTFVTSLYDSVSSEPFEISYGPQLEFKPNHITLKGDTELGFNNIDNFNIENNFTFIIRAKLNTIDVYEQIYIYFTGTNSNSGFKFNLDISYIHMKGYNANNALLYENYFNNIKKHININDFNTYFVVWNNANRTCKIYINDGFLSINTVNALELGNMSFSTVTKMRIQKSGDDLHVAALEMYKKELTFNERLDYYNNFV